MAEIIFEVATCVLAAYGLMVLIHQFLVYIKQHNKGYRNSQVKLVLIVRNQGETIEGVLRKRSSQGFLSENLCREESSMCLTWIRMMIRWIF